MFACEIVNMKTTIGKGLAEHLYMMKLSYSSKFNPSEKKTARELYRRHRYKFVKGVRALERKLGRQSRKRPKVFVFEREIYNGYEKSYGVAATSTNVRRFDWGSPQFEGNHLQ